MNKPLSSPEILHLGHYAQDPYPSSESNFTPFCPPNFFDASFGPELNMREPWSQRILMSTHTLALYHMRKLKSQYVALQRETMRILPGVGPLFTCVSKRMEM